MQKVNPEEIGGRIRAAFLYFDGKEKFKGEFRPTESGVAAFAGASKRFHDFCQIGALLSDEQRCMDHLAELSKQMASRLVAGLSSGRFDGGNARLAQLGRLQHRLTPDEVKKAAASDAPPRPKFYSVLREVLENNERRWGFTTPTRPASDATVLSGFVHPQSFETLLLEQARHWKDPGASIDHGEYTHRLQWWIVCRECDVGGPYSLKGRPVDRFKVLPQYKTASWRGAQLRAVGMEEETAQSIPSLASVYTNRSMWDFLFDAVPANDSMAATTPASDSFRSPQYMNLFLTSADAIKKYPAIFLLHIYLVTRYNKRSIQYARNQLRPYKTVLCAKWNLTEEQFDKLFADETLYGKEDILATVDGKVVSKPWWK
jgi:hypothetical protein